MSIQDKDKNAYKEEKNNSKSYNAINHNVRRGVAIGVIAALTAGSLFIDYSCHRKKNADSQKESTEVVQMSPLEETLTKFDNGWSVIDELPAKDRDSFGRYSRIFESFLDKDYSKQITSNLPELSEITKRLYDGNSENGETVSVRFVNGALPYNLVYEMRNKDKSVSYGFAKVTEEHAKQIADAIKAYSDKKVNDAFSKIDKDGVLVNYDFAKAIIRGEGGEGKLPARTDVFTFALGKSDEMKNEASSDIAEYLFQLCDKVKSDSEFDSAKGYSMKLYRNTDGTGKIDFYTVSPSGKNEVKTLHYSDKDYFDELRRVVEIVAKDYQYRHPNENIYSNKN